MEYKSRSVRLAEDTWEALQASPMSANQLLRIALGLADPPTYDTKDAVTILTEKIPEDSPEGNLRATLARRLERKPNVVHQPRRPWSGELKKPKDRK